jgi:hypothetical protein
MNGATPVATVPLTVGSVKRIHEQPGVRAYRALSNERELRLEKGDGAAFRRVQEVRGHGRVHRHRGLHGDRLRAR